MIGTTLHEATRSGITPLLTTTEVMSILRKNRNTICRWTREGKLPAVRMPDNSYLYDPVAIREWIALRTS